MRIAWDKVRKNTILLSLFLGALCVMAIILGILGALVYFKEYVIWFILIGTGIGCYKWGHKDGSLDVNTPLHKEIERLKRLNDLFVRKNKEERWNRKFDYFRTVYLDRNLEEENEDLSHVKEVLASFPENSEEYIEFKRIKSVIFSIREDDKKLYLEHLESKKLTT